MSSQIARSVPLPTGNSPSLLGNIIQQRIEKDADGVYRKYIDLDLKGGTISNASLQNVSAEGSDSSGGIVLSNTLNETLGTESNNLRLDNSTFFDETQAAHNVVLGAYAGGINDESDFTGSGNVMVGVNAGWIDVVDSSTNKSPPQSSQGSIYIGARAGVNVRGDNNIIIQSGNDDAGLPTTLQEADNALVIGKIGAPLIAGDLDNQTLTVNGALTVADTLTAVGQVTTLNKYVLLNGLTRGEVSYASSINNTSPTTIRNDLTMKSNGATMVLTDNAGAYSLVAPGFSSAAASGITTTKVATGNLTTTSATVQNGLTIGQGISFKPNTEPTEDAEMVNLVIRNSSGNEKWSITNNNNYDLYIKRYNIDNTNDNPIFFEWLTGKVTINSLVVNKLSANSSPVEILTQNSTFGSNNISPYQLGGGTSFVDNNRTAPFPVRFTTYDSSLITQIETTPPPVASEPNLLSGLLVSWEIKKSGLYNITTTYNSMRYVSGNPGLQLATNGAVLATFSGVETPTAVAFDSSPRSASAVVKLVTGTTYKFQALFRNGDPYGITYRTGDGATLADFTNGGGSSTVYLKGKGISVTAELLVPL